MTILTLTLIAASSSGISATGLYFLFKKVLNNALDKLSASIADTKSEIRSVENSLRSHVADETNQIHRKIEEVGQAASKDIKTSEQAVVGYLDEHKEELLKQTEEIKAHARGLMEAGHQAQNSVVMRRVLCPICNRVVVKFKLNEDGTIKGCLDCLAKQ